MDLHLSEPAKKTPLENICLSGLLPPMSLATELNANLVWQGGLSLKLQDLWSPSPLLLFERPICDQLIHFTSLAAALFPHQKRFIKEFNCFNSVFGSLKMLMLYIGIACTTGFKSTSFPAWEMNFSFHPSSFLWTIFKIPAKVWVLEWPTRVGSPKYLSKEVVAWIPTEELMKSLNSLIVLLL
jgi:hypothetical protein